MKFMFDVIIPTYNSVPEFLKEAIDSVLNQTYQDFQIYICDGTPHDSPIQIEQTLAHYDDERIHLLKQTGVGPSNARNEAVRVGNNPYVALLDSDDVWVERKLEYVARFIQENNPVMMWSAVKLRWTDDITDYRTGFLEDWNTIALEHRWFRIYWLPLATSSIVFRRDELEKIGLWNENLFLGEDTELNVRMIKSYSESCFQINRYMGYYRKHENQTTLNESHFNENLRNGLNPNDRPQLFKTTFEKLKQESTKSYPANYWLHLEKIVQEHRIASDNPNERDWENYILLRVDGTENGSKFKEHPLELGGGGF
jgi:glycosyltransferase involved in cell wall biosynthesis